MAEGKAADGGQVQVEGEAARNLAGGEAVAGRRHRTEEPAQEWLDRGQPERGVIAARSARLPAALGACGAGAEVVGVDLVKAGAPDFESRSGRRGREPARAEGGEDFADQRCAAPMRSVHVCSQRDSARLRWCAGFMPAVCRWQIARCPWRSGGDRDAWHRHPPCRDARGGWQMPHRPVSTVPR